MADTRFHCDPSQFESLLPFEQGLETYNYEGHLDHVAKTTHTSLLKSRLPFCHLSAYFASRALN